MEAYELADARMQLMCASYKMSVATTTKLLLLCPRTSTISTKQEELQLVPGFGSRIVAARLRSLGYVPGFGHQLYPDRDSERSEADYLRQNLWPTEEVELAKRLIRASHALTSNYPNLDFGLTMFVSHSNCRPKKCSVLACRVRNSNVTHPMGGSA